MKYKDLQYKMNIESLIKEKQRLANQHIDAGNLYDISIEQRDFYLIDGLKEQLVDQLITLLQKPFKSKIFQSFVQKYKQNLTSLATFATDLVNFAHEYPVLSFGHKHHTSQSILLSLLISKIQNKKVVLIVDESRISRSCQMFACQDELDKIAFVKSSLSKQNIQLVHLSLTNVKALTLDNNQIAIFDVFGLDPPQYIISVLKSYRKLRNAASLIYYYSQHQAVQIEQLFKHIQKQHGQNQPLILQLAPPHPLQTGQCENYSQMFSKIFDLISSISRYAEKQDIVIFYPLDEPLYKYVRRFKQDALKASIKDSYNLITAPCQQLQKQKVNIFLVKNDQQLRRWKYDFSKVFMVLDYGYQSNFLFDYQLGCYVQQVTEVSLREKSKRLLWVSSDRCGSYYYLLNQEFSSQSYLDCYAQLSSFVIEAIYEGQLQLLDFGHERVAKCLKFLVDLGVISENEKSQKKEFKITDQRLISYIPKNISPIQAKLMFNVIDDVKLIDKNKQKFLNLMAIVISVINSQGSLRKLKQQLEGSHIKPYAIWRKSGYLQSCIEIITKCELIESRRHNSISQQFRRKTSKSLEGKLDIYDKHHNKRKKQFEDMDVNDLIADYTVNQELLHVIRDKIEDLRLAFEFDMIPILIDKESINKIMKYIMIAANKSNLCVYTGSKTSEYYNGKENLYLDQNCLFYILNQRPELIKIVRMTEMLGKRTIYLANSAHKQAYTEIFGNLPVFQRILVNKVDTKIEGSEQVIKQALEVSKQFDFQNVCSAVLQLLVKDNGRLVEQFQLANNSHLNIHMQQGKITLKCFKDEIENKNYVKQNLNMLLRKLNQICKNYTKKLHYLGVLNFVLREGGEILDIVDSDQTSRCLFKHLPPEITKEYVEVMLEDYPVKNIQVLDANNYDEKPSAIVQFYSKRAYQQFFEKFQAQRVNDFQITLQPLKDSQYGKLKNQQQKNQLLGLGTSKLVFKWFTWKSHGTAQVKFKQLGAVQATVLAFEVNPFFDNAKVKIIPDPKDKFIVNIQNLDKHTDEIYIAEALSNYGQIESVQILKTPLKQTMGDAEHIGHLIKKATGKKQFVKYKILSFQKKEFGQRIANVALQDYHLINYVSQQLNRGIDLFGEGRLYVQPQYERQILIPEGFLQIYSQLYEDLLKSMQKDKPKIKFQIKQDEQNIFMVLMSPIQQTLLYVLARFKQKLGGVKVDFPLSAKNIILNEIGVANFLDMQEKFNCKFIISVYSAKIKVIAKQEYLQAINHQVKDRINNHFFYKVPLTSKNYKNYQANQQALSQIQKKFDLNLIELQEDNFSILLEGSALQIKQAIEQIYAKSKTQGKMNQIQGGNVCGVCCQKLQDSYLLYCQHRFCRQCLVDYLRYSLGDMSMFPLKCPDNSCRKLINCIDLQQLFEYVDWHKIKTITANEFLKTNQNYSYCMTPGCEQINKLQKSTMDGIISQFMRCDVCKSTFCLKCNAAYHPARTCDQAKISEDVMLKKYVEQQGVRKCPGKKCKALVMRYTGCFKVQCSRCNTCMCFKCPAGDMAFYDNPRDCYDHLNEIHGGYH